MKKVDSGNYPQRIRRKLSKRLPLEIYEILSEDPDREWDLAEIQDRIGEKWPIRPYRSSIEKAAENFYREHHIPFIYRAGFDSDKYKLNTNVDQEQLKAAVTPRRKKRINPHWRHRSLQDLPTREALREYHKRYKDVVRHIEKYAMALFAEHEGQVSADQIAGAVRDDTNIHMSRATVCRAMSQAMAKYGDFTEVSPGVYRQLK